MPSSGHMTFSGCVMTSAAAISHSSHVARINVRAEAEQSRMPQLFVNGPFDEREMHDDLRTHPMPAHARQAGCFGEWRRRYLERVETRPQLQEQLRVEAGADFPGEHEIVSIEV